MAREIKVGDVVHLRSGGPLMTAKSGKDAHGVVDCVWMDGPSHVMSASFRSECLEFHSDGQGCCVKGDGVKCDKTEKSFGGEVIESLNQFTALLKSRLGL